MMTFYRALRDRAQSALVRLRIQWDKWHQGWHLTEMSEGRFCVHYPDGKRSARFHYSTAKDYAELFGGKVVHLATGRELDT